MKLLRNQKESVGWQLCGFHERSCQQSKVKNEKLSEKKLKKVNNWHSNELIEQ